MTDGAVVRTRDVLLVLMPDYLAPEMHTRQRLAPLGPAVVAACIAADDLRVRAVDLLMDQDALARSDDERDAFGSGRRVEAWLRGGDDPGLSALLERTIAHLDPARLRDADVIALSVDRGSQGGFALALSAELKRRFDALLFGELELMLPSARAGAPFAARVFRAPSTAHAPALAPAPRCL